jgi:uncharacterized protein YkwD
MSVRLFALLAIFAVCATSGATHPFGGPTPTSSRKVLGDQLLLPDPDKRAPAVARFRADGTDGATEFAAALNRAEPIAIGSLRRLLQLVKPTDPSFDALSGDLKAYLPLAEAAKVLVQTDHHKDQKKFAEMDRAFAEAEKARKKIERALKPQSTAGQFFQALEWVAEIRRDQDFAAEKSADLATLPLSAVLEVEGAAPGIGSLVKDIEPYLARRALHRVTSSAHALMKWARPEQLQYAELLNERRVVLGLRPMLLAEKLSAACAQHSEEMVKMKYFAHESPVPANKGFGDRVRNAGFEGNGSGECIYAGGAAATAAHSGWWYSDGHRLILYSNGPVAQGIAKFATTWTFLTGSFAKFPL